MFDDLFQKKPEYDENGQLVGYSQPKIVWVILALVVLYFCKNKIIKQTGGGASEVMKMILGVLALAIIAAAFVALTIFFAIMEQRLEYWKAQQTVARGPIKFPWE